MGLGRGNAALSSLLRASLHESSGLVASGTKSANVLRVVVVVCGVGGIAEEEAMELSAVSKLSSDMSTDKSGLITPLGDGTFFEGLSISSSAVLDDGVLW